MNIVFEEKRGTLADQNVFVLLLLPVRLLVQIHLNRIDGGQVVEVKVLSPEAEVSLELGGGSRIQRAVEADLAKVPLLRGYSFRLQQPNLQGVVRSACLFRIRLNRFPQTTRGQ